MTRIITPGSYASELDDIRRRLAALETAPSLQSSSIKNGSLRVNDGTRDRVILGKQGDSTYGLNLYDASGNLIFDALGLVAVMKSLGIANPGAQNIATASAATFTDVTSATVAVTVTRAVNILCVFLGNAQISAGTGSGYVRANSGGAGINSGNLTWSGTGVRTCMGWLYLAAVAAGSYTFKLEGSTDAATTLALVTTAIQVFQLGA